jgi:hypothetical protein
MDPRPGFRAERSGHIAGPSPWIPAPSTCGDDRGDLKADGGVGPNSGDVTDGGVGTQSGDVTDGGVGTNSDDATDGGVGTNPCDVTDGGVRTHSDDATDGGVGTSSSDVTDEGLSNLEDDESSIASADNLATMPDDLQKTAGLGSMV